MPNENQGDATLNGGEPNQNIEPNDLDTLREEHSKTVKERDQWKDKARKYEQAAQSASQWQKQVEDLTVEKSNIYTELTNLKTQIRDEKVTSHLTTALEAAGARSVEGALKLIDRSKIEFGDDGNVKQDSIVGIVNALKTSDGWAFKTEAEMTDPKKSETPSKSTTNTSSTPPTVKDAAQTVSASGFETEIKACKTVAEIQAVMRKYERT